MSGLLQVLMIGLSNDYPTTSGSRPTRPSSARAPTAEPPNSAAFRNGSIDNLTDDVITPQLGLARPGRGFRLGVQLN